jgi:hypothetical protein
MKNQISATLKFYCKLTKRRKLIMLTNNLFSIKKNKRKNFKNYFKILFKTCLRSYKSIKKK